MASKLATLLSLVSLLAPSTAAAETVLGVYIFHRHGDRTPKSLGNVNLTALGADQVYQSGSYYRSRYVSSSSSSPILGLQPDIADTEQVAISAAADAVLQNSAFSFLQGVYPPAGTAGAQELANGSTVQGPLGGYQYVPVNLVVSATTSADAESSEWLQGGSGCGKAVVSSNNYFVSSEYKTTYNETADFYQALLPVINGTFGESKANFKNAYTIFDLVNVATIHNKTIPSSSLLTNSTLDDLKWYANTHEWNLAYNASDPIRAVAGMTLAGQILAALNATLTGESATPFNVQFGAYASFLSFFGLAQMPAISEDFTGVVDYASSMVFELVTNSSVSSGGSYPSNDDVSVRFLFVNGSAGLVEPQAYPLFGRQETELPWSTFVTEMNKFAVADTKSWCAACGNSTGVCASSASSSGGDASTSSTGGSDRGNGISLPVAGVIGALVTLVVILGIEGLVYAIAGLKLVKKSTLAGATATSGGAGVAGSKA
ncbi:histidine phosphatase superfamily [Pseudomassariella vexata]|uniref:Histidine phosphatase superfamily n=1 Tax=Pseudomassariella vexata TaxID=1141098 RepID=A0A1Y2DBP7_9PEZI|nr:histidine phosphatase superfamily [Pseudomassariella vexata]ORY56703.1 histidine phosphatase superfamily [Pseudomassariella vexata]